MKKDRIYKVLDRYRITKGKKFRLKDVDPKDTYGLKSELKAEAKTLLQEGVRTLAEMQDKLYAQDRWSVLLIFQAMDAAGKDGTIKHVMSGVNPQGCQVSSLQGAVERGARSRLPVALHAVPPERGRIGIFNRSYYEEVLVVRVHPRTPCRAEAAAGRSSRSASGRSATRTSTTSSGTSRATAR